jgi:hypothetical protein
VDDHVDLGVEDILDRAVRHGMRRGQLLVTMRLVDECLELVGRERWQERMRRSRAATGRHDLDEVGALGDQAPDGGPDALDAVGGAAEVVEVATGDGHRAPGDDHQRAVGDAPPDRVADDERHPAHRPVLADGGDAGAEHRLGVHGRPDEQELLTLGRDVVTTGPVADAGQVGVPVDEAGQEGRVPVVVRRGAGAVGRSELGPAPDRPDRRAFHEDGGIVHRWRAGPVEQPGRGKDGERTARSCQRLPP